MVVMCGNINCGYQDRGLCTRGVIEIEQGTGICKYLKNRHWADPVPDECKVKNNIIVLEKRKENLEDKVTSRTEDKIEESKKDQAGLSEKTDDVIKGNEESNASNEHEQDKDIKSEGVR